MSHPEKKTHERRREKRLAINEEVFEQASGKSIGYTGDLNANGMMLIGSTQFEIGEKTNINLNIPDGKTKKKRISLTAQCQWSEPHCDTPFYNSGFKFIYNNLYDVEFIETIIFALAVK